MANKETRIYKTDTLEKLRQKSNEISLHLGDNEQLNALMADKTYVYSASSGQTLFAGSDTSSPAKTARFETSPAHTIDNTAGYIILESVSSLDSSYVEDAVVYQGTSGTPSWQAYIVSATTDKILVRDSSGTFSSSADLKVGASSPDTVDAANVIRIVIESYPVAIARVYNNGTELTQGMGPNGFHAADIKATITHTGSPTLTNFTRGVTVYQGSSQTTQAGVETNADWYGTLHSVSDGVIRVKTYNGSFIPTGTGSSIRALGSSNTITAHGSLTAIDNTYGSYIELTTPATGSNQIKVFSLDLVAAINELQDDIGTVESLTTAANDLVLAINEHDAELGTITALAMGTAASTVETAIREHEDQIGNESISTVDAGDSNNTITGALNQLHAEVGDVTLSNLGTDGNANLTAAIREHEDQIGNHTEFHSISSADNTISKALDQLHVEVGDLALHTSANDLTEAVNELEEDLFNGEGATKRTRSDLLTTDKTSILDAINEIHSELFVNGTGVSFAGLSADYFKEAVEELRTELGDHTALDTNVTTSAVAAINELENVLRDDLSERTGYAMGTNAHNIIDAINEIEAFLRGANGDYQLTTAAQNVRDSLREHEDQIGNMAFGTGGPVDAANSTNLSAAVRVIDAEIGDTDYSAQGSDITTAIKNIYDDINTSGSLTSLHTTNTNIVDAINEIEADLFNSGNAGSGGNRREMSDLKTADKTSILDAINEIYDDIHTTGSVTLDTTASHLVGAINEIESVFDASTYEISAGANSFGVTSGQFLINSSADIILDADGGDIKLRDNGSANEFGAFSHTGNGNLIIKSGTTTMLTGSGTNATFNNNLTVENNLTVSVNTTIGGTLGVVGHTSLSTLGVSGDVGVGGNLSVTGTTELDSTLGVDGNFRVGVNKFNVVAASGNTQIDGTLEVDGTAGVDGNFRVGADKFNVTAASGNTQIDGTLEVDGTGGIDGNFRVGNNKFNVTAASGNTQIDGTLDVDGNFEVGATKFNVTASNGNFVAKGTGRVDGHTDLNSSLTVDGHGEFNSTVNVDGVTTISNGTASSSSTTGALVVTGGVGIGEDLYVAGDLYVEGDTVELNTETLTVEDTLVLAGNGLTSEPSTGGFGLEVGPITSPSGVASNVTGAHSIVYNYGHDNGDGTYGRWEADGALILSTATLNPPQIESVDFGPSDNLTFSAGLGLSETVTKTGATVVTNYINTDRGSSQKIFKTVAPSSGTSATADVNSDTLNITQGTGITTVGSGDNIITITNTDRGSSQDIFKNILVGAVTIDADGNDDTLTFTDDDVVNISANSGTQTLSLTHKNVLTDNSGTAGNFGPSTQDGKYIKSLTLTAEGHVSAITTGDFDTRYQATNPYWVLQSGGTELDQVGNTDTVNFVGGDHITITDSKVGETSTITIAHEAVTEAANLVQNNSGNTFIQDLSLTFDDFGHVTGATASTGSVTIGNGTFTVSGSSGLAGSGSMTANQSGNSSAGLTNTDKGSSQYIFKNVSGDSGTAVADNNDDTLTITGGTNITTSVTGDTLTITNDYSHPVHPGDDINIDTGALTGAWVISDLDFNINSDTQGHVTDANGTVATRQLTLSDLSWDGWDLYVEGIKKADINVNGVVNFGDDGFLTTSFAAASNNKVSFGHPVSGITAQTYGQPGTEDGSYIKSVTVDSRGHISAITTDDFDDRYDNYDHWHLTADTGGTAQIDSNETVDIAGGNKINTVRSGNTVTVNLDANHGFLTSQRTATFEAVNSGVDGNDVILRLDDGTSDDVRITDSGTVTVSYTNPGQFNIHGNDTNTDIDVSTANLKTRLSQLSGDDIYIGDTSNDNTIIVRGNFHVEGTETTVNNETLKISDNKIILNSDQPNSAPTQNSFVEIERGSYVNAYIKWNETTNRWQYAEGDTTLTIRSFSRADDDADKTTFKIEVDDNGQATITKDEVLGIRGGTAISTDYVTTVSGENHTLQVSHSDVSHSDTTVAGQTLAASGTFSAVTGVDVNSQGHVTEVITKPFTLPASAIPNNGTLSMSTGTGLDGTATFTADQAGNSSFAVTLDLSELTDMTAAVDGAQDELILLDNSEERRKLISEINLGQFNNDQGYTSNAGDITAVNITAGVGLVGSVNTASGDHNQTLKANLISETLRAVTAQSITTTASRTYAVMPDGDGDLVVNVPWVDTQPSAQTTFQVEDGDGDEVTISNGKEWKFVEGSEDVDATDNNYIQINWSDTSTGSDADPYDLKFSHKRTTRTNTTTGSATTSFGGNFTIVDGVTTNATGHVTGVNTKTITMPSNPNSDTFLNDVSTIDNGANMILRHTMSNATSHDVGITAGTNITLTPGTETFEIATTAQVNQNAFGYLGVGRFDSGTQGTVNAVTMTANAVSTTASINFWKGFDVSGSGLATTVKLANDRRSQYSTDDIHIGGNTHDYIYADADVGLSFFTANSEDMRLTDGGTLHVDGDIVAYSTTISDERLKENIQVVDNALDKVCQLNGVTFSWKHDGEKSAGLIAQDVEKVLPTAIKEKELPLKLDDGIEYKTVEYSQVTSLLVEAIKELREENKLLRADIESLKDINK